VLFKDDFCGFCHENASVFLLFLGDFGDLGNVNGIHEHFFAAIGLEFDLAIFGGKDSADAAEIKIACDLHMFSDHGFNQFIHFDSPFFER
jgi:hypothetical protein